MKMFKKALVAGLGLVSMAAIASCNKKQEPVTYDVTSAAKRVVVENDKKESVTADFEVAKKVNYKNAEYTVTWTSNNEFATVKNIEGNDSKYLIDIEYVKNQSSDQAVKLTAEIKDPNGETVTKEFNFTVPKFVVNTIAEYDASQKGDFITLKGTVVAKEAYNEKDKNTNLYLMCEEGGFEAYKLSCSAEGYEKDLTIGSVLYIAGTQATYNGLRELSPSSYFVTDEPKQTITAEDLTSTVAAGTGISNALQGHYVTLKDVEIVSIEDKTADQYSIYVGDPADTKKQANIRISKYFAPKDSDLRKEYDGLNLVVGQKITVKGFVGWYNDPQITLFETGAITAGAVDYAHNYGLSLLAKTSYANKIYGSQTITLPTSLYEAGLSGDNYNGLTASWTSSSENVTIATEDVAATGDKPAYTTTKATTGNAKETVTLTLTVKNAAGETVFTATKALNTAKEIVITTHDQYIAAKANDPVTVQGTIAYIYIAKNKASFTLVDDAGKSYYVYGLAVTNANKNSLVAGKKVIIDGYVALYQNLIEVTSAKNLGDVELVKAENGTKVTPTTITELPTVTPENQAQYVTFTGVVKEKNRTFVITVGEGANAKDITCYVSSGSDFSFVPEVGTKVTVTGFLGVFKTTSQVMVNCADDIVTVTE